MIRIQAQLGERSRLAWFNDSLLSRVPLPAGEVHQLNVISFRIPPPQPALTLSIRVAKLPEAIYWGWISLFSGAGFCFVTYAIGSSESMSLSLVVGRLLNTSVM